MQHLIVKPKCSLKMALNLLKNKVYQIDPQKDEIRYSRAYVSELASQFRDQEMILVTIQ
jgi:hypothetical protein